MNVLLDTHAFLWFVWGDPRLSAAARAAISAPANLAWISPASYWEIAVKLSAGKLALSEPYQVFIPREIRQNQFDILHISVEHCSVVATLPFHHRDPFDRLLAAQALVENVPLVSADSVFDAYGVTRLW
jgi:PIN domain nuclease of toxin-antitoxin system